MDEALLFLREAMDGSNFEFDQAIEQRKDQYQKLFAMWNNVSTTSAIAHYNAAVELEYLKMWPEALTQFNISRDLVLKYMGE